MNDTKYHFNRKRMNAPMEHDLNKTNSEASLNLNEYSFERLQNPSGEAEAFHRMERRHIEPFSMSQRKDLAYGHSKKGLRLCLGMQTRAGTN